MTKLVMRRGSWGLWTAEVDGEDIGVHKLDQVTVLLQALVKHAGIEVEFEICDGLLEDRRYVVDEDGELRSTLDMMEPEGKPPCTVMCLECLGGPCKKEAA